MIRPRQDLTRVGVRRPQRHRGHRRGLSLLEVILAIAILGGALTVIGELVRMGTRAAISAQEQSIGQFLCDAKMAEVAAGVLPLQAQSPTAIEDASDWLCSVEVVQSEQVGLLQVMVQVEQDPSSYDFPQAVRLYRFVPDPTYIEELEAASEQVF